MKKGTKPPDLTIVSIDTVEPLNLVERNRLNSLEAALERLEANLKTALQDHVANTGTRGRSRALKALMAFTDEAGLPTDLNAPIRATMAAISDKKISETEHGQKPLEEGHVMAILSLAVDLLAEHGMSPRSRAAKAVVGAATVPGLSSEQLLTFRNNLRKGNANARARSSYSTARRLWNSDPQGRQLVSRLPNEIAQKIILDFAGGQILGAK